MLRFVTREPVQKGWSGDQKYCVTDELGKRYLLRVSPAERYERIQRTFQKMKEAADLGVCMCQPVECGIFEDGVYVLHSWIEGRDAEEVMPGLCGSEQYAYGLEAGKALKSIHSIPAPEGSPKWEDHFNRKLDRKIKAYLECPVQYPGGEAFITYINENRNLLAGRPVTYQHGDYHVGNMMIDKNGKLVIIDFDRDDYGDPWEEFNRIVWCAQCAPDFACGMVDGYFSGEIPLEFWRLLALYIAGNSLSSIPWAIPFGQKEVDVMLRQGQDVLRWYDSMKNPVPAWYLSH